MNEAIQASRLKKESDQYTLFFIAALRIRYSTSLVYKEFGESGGMGGNLNFLWVGTERHKSQLPPLSHLNLAMAFPKEGRI